MNPAREVKTERFSRTEGKTPAFVEGEVQRLLDVIETSTHTGLRDRALLGVLAYTFARIGAVVNLKVEDYYPSGKRFLLRFKEKGGKEKELPVHHKLEELLDEYLKTTGLGAEPGSLLFPAALERPASYRVGRWCAPTPQTCSKDGSNKPDYRRTIHLTHSGRPGSRIFWKMKALLKPLNESLATPIVGPQSSMTAAVRRFCSRIWRGFGTNLELWNCAESGTKCSEDQVFIRYSHKDTRWRDDLHMHLKPYLRDGSTASWSDQQIGPGSSWFREIQSALTIARSPFFW